MQDLGAKREYNIPFISIVGVHHVCTVAENGQNKHFGLREILEFLTYFSAGEGETRGGQLV